MTSKKIIAVVGATGAQGGSVVQYLLKDGTFAVRAITRNPDSAAAKALDVQGAQVVKADSDDPASLLKAFNGVHGVFAVTNFAEPGVGVEGEVRHGKHLVDAAKSTGVAHFIWSTLDRSEFKAANFESKADVDDYLKLSGLPRTSLYTAYYFENFTGRLSLKRKDDGSYYFPLPVTTDAPLPIYSVAETGAYALAAFKDPDEWINKDMLVASEFLSFRQVAQTMSKVSGKTVHVQEVSPELFQTFKNNPIPELFHNMFSASFAKGKVPYRDPELSRKLNPGMKNFQTWVEENATKLFA